MGIIGGITMVFNPSCICHSDSRHVRIGWRALLAAMFILVMSPVQAQDAQKREPLDEYNIGFYGSNATPLSFDDIKGKCGMIYVVQLYELDYFTNTAGKVDKQRMDAYENLWIYLNTWAEEHCYQHGLYFQVITVVNDKYLPTKSKLDEVLKKFNVKVPVIVGSRAMPTKMGQFAQEQLKSALLVIDPARRIIARSPRGTECGDFDALGLPSSEAIVGELDDFTLERYSDVIRKADQEYERSKFPEAYDIYCNLPETQGRSVRSAMIIERIGRVEAAVAAARARYVLELNEANSSDVIKQTSELKEDYRKTRLVQALVEARDQVKKAMADPALLFALKLDAANALYRNGEFEAATRAFQELLKSETLDEALKKELEYRAARTTPSNSAVLISVHQDPEVCVKQAAEYRSRAESLLGPTNASEEATAQALELVVSSVDYLEAAVASPLGAPKQAPEDLLSTRAFLAQILK